MSEAAHVAAVLSDDGRAIVAWSEQQGAETGVYIDRSGARVRFRSAQLLESFSDPDGLSAPAASPSLVRLSSESVMVAWAGASAGHWVVRTAPVYKSGVGGTARSPRRARTYCSECLAAGPAADALVLWTQPQPSAGAAGGARTASRSSPRRASMPRIAHRVRRAANWWRRPRRCMGSSAAYDPDSDRAVAVWRGQDGRIEYSDTEQRADPVSGRRLAGAARSDPVLGKDARGWIETTSAKRIRPRSATGGIEGEGRCSTG